MRSYLVRLFGLWGIESVPAASAEEALSVLKEMSPDLITLDLELGAGLDGAEALPLIKAQAPTVPVVVISSRDDPDLVADLIRAGATDFLAKPFRQTDFKRTVIRALDLECSIL